MGLSFSLTIIFVVPFLLFPLFLLNSLVTDQIRNVVWKCNEAVLKMIGMLTVPEGTLANSY